jgi:hypothetical protein
MIGDHNGLGTWTVWYDYGEFIHGPVKNWGFKDARPDAQDNRYVYSIPDYKGISRHNTPGAWAVYRALKNLWDKVYSENLTALVNRQISHSDIGYKFVDALRNDAELCHLADDFYNLVYAGRNYGDTCTLDIRACNFGADDKGNLAILPMVLIDTHQIS